MLSLFESLRPRYPELSGKVALITGSSRGIGKGILLRLAREGMRVVLHGLDQPEVDHAMAELLDLHLPLVSVAADLRQDAEIEKLFQTTLDTFGRLDVLVNNAADIRMTRFFNASTPLLDNQLSVNIRAPYLCAQRAAEHMRSAKQGCIINISSVGGIRSHWAGLPYDISKGALDAMTRAMALELSQVGIRVNAVAPGAIQTERTRLSEAAMQAVSARIPLARFGLPTEIGNTVAFLASDDASYITGQILYVDGGITAQLSPPGQPI